MPLVYNLINNGTEYEIGAGSCTAGSVIIPDTYLGKPVTSIGQFAFINCSTITSVSIPSSVISIKYRSFENCTNLEDITFSEGLVSIELESFTRCTKLNNVIFPSTLINIGTEAFKLAFKLGSTLTIKSDLSSVGSIFNGSTLTNVIISEGVTTINSNFFALASSITNISFPNSLIKIEADAFNSCVSLSAINFPSNLKFIENQAFSNCRGIKNIEMPDSVTNLGSGAFALCNNLTKIELSKNLTQLLSSTFSFCTLLKSIFIPKKINLIGDFCFSRCDALTEIYFEGNAPSFGSNIFNNIVGNTKLYRKKNFVTGWPDSVQGVPVVLWSDNIIKSGGTGKLIGNSYICRFTISNSSISNINGIYIKNLESDLIFRDANNNNYYIIYNKILSRWEILQNINDLGIVRYISTDLINWTKIGSRTPNWDPNTIVTISNKRK